MLAGCLTFFGIFFAGLYLFGNKKKNPYISTHLKKWKAEKDYKEYIDWLDKKGGDLPLPELKFKEDVEVLKQIEKNFK